MSNCCHQPDKPQDTQEVGAESSCHTGRSRPDYLLWFSLAGVALLYLQSAFFIESLAFADWYRTLSGAVYELVNTMWWGVVIGILMLALLSKIPREFVMSILGTNKGLNGILRATAAGVLLDLCSHGILMVGAKLYERGASLGQVMAFLIASPWNSFSLTLILIALIGWGWTLAFILLSMLIAISAGLIFDALANKGVLPANQNKTDLPEGFRFWLEARSALASAPYGPKLFGEMLLSGIKDSRMVLRWVLFGVLLAGVLRALIPADQFGVYFGPTLAGLGLTILVATLLEVCSEGSTPIAADILTSAGAPGNSFAFLMTGVSTDYTEIMVLREATKSWKIALFLPLLTVPQVLFVAWLMNLLWV